MPQIMVKVLKIPWYLLNQIFFGRPLAGLLWERQFEEAVLELGWKKIPNWDCVFGRIWLQRGRN